MHSSGALILVINGGSSSIKFALYHSEAQMTRTLHGKVDRIGTGGTSLSFTTAGQEQPEERSVPGADLAAAIDDFVGWLSAREEFQFVTAIGHRVVHGMNHAEPERVTPAVLSELRRIIPCDPDHLPGEIQIIEAFTKRYPKLVQIACFDTAFHRTMPRVAKILPIPREYGSKGLERYGFHGLSYEYLMEELARVAGAEASRKRVILAHLGNGASMAAVKDGKGIDTSMGFTPTAGIPMSTRSGDLDPGLGPYLARTEQMTAEQFSSMVNHRSGLIGISETSSDMRDLLLREGEDWRAAEAVDFFCYQARKQIGAYAAALGGLDTLVFAGGIGENADPVRERICSGLGFLGLELDPSRNRKHSGIISTDTSRVTVRVIRTDEEVIIARSVHRLLDGSDATQTI